MAKKQRKYDMEYKIQAVKPAKELGGAKAASELGIPENTMYAWTKAAREGRLDAGSGSHTPQTAMSLAEELSILRRQVKEQENEIRRLKEENEFLEETGAFSPPAVGSLQKAENDVSCHKNRGRRYQGKDFFLLSDAESDTTGGFINIWLIKTGRGNIRI